MARKRKVSIDDMWAMRGENYAAHVDARRLAETFEPRTRAIVANLLTELPRPILNAWGVQTSTNYTEKEWRHLVRIANQLQIEAWLCCPWYWSDEGWKDFQDQFEALPEPIHMGVDKSLLINREHGFVDAKAAKD